MIRGRKALSALMAIVLAVGLMPLPAFADDGSHGTQGDLARATLVAGSLQTAGESLNAQLEGAESATDVDLSAIEFVYLESDELEAGLGQNIVIGFADDGLTTTGAQLAIAREDGSLLVAHQAESVEGAVLFALAADDLAVGTYEVRELLFNDANGALCRANFADDDSESADYRFSVVPAADAQQAPAAGSISAYTVNDAGELVATDDIASAMAAAGIDPSSGPEPFSTAGDGMDSSPEGGLLATQAEKDGFVIVLDPGHGGSDGGATGIGIQEKDVNLKIAKYCKEALERVPGVTVYMTRESDVYVSLDARVEFAVDRNADIIVSIHNNSSGNGVGKGSEVIVPRYGEWYYDETAVTGHELGDKILAKLNALGLATHGGVYARDATVSEYYPDGTLTDYYHLVREPRRSGLLGIIIEHAFVDNASDAAFLGSDENLKKLGEADAKAIVEYYDSSEGIDRLYWSVFDYDYYTSQYPSVEEQHGPGKLQVFGYFKSTGMSEGQRGNVLFDVQFYKDKYEDLRNMYGDNLAKYYQHFIDRGMGEGRQPSADFVPQYYKANYDDLRAAFGTNMERYYRHYLKYGIEEGRVANELLPGAILDSDVDSMFRLYNPNSGEHFYTAADSECDFLIDQGWRYEGIGWAAPSLSNTPVYRVYNRNGGEHHYTTSAEERDFLVSVGWEDEGIGWYSDDAQGVPLYRQYNPNAFSCNHNYTTNREENDNLVAQGWREEGIGWYGLDYEAESERAKFDDEAIMGTSKTSVEQMVRRYDDMGKEYPSSVYAQYGASSIEEFCETLFEEANAEGVRAEVVFAQAMHETGWLQYGGDVQAEQCNFAGIGATGGGEPGNSFNTYGTDSVRMGLRVQVQHLKAYASTDSLNNPTVDPRFALVKRGSATTVQALGGKWAVGSGYGDALVTQIRALLSA